MVEQFCVYCGHRGSDHKVTELPGDRSKDIPTEFGTLRHRPWRADCHCGCDEMRWDLERFVRDCERAGEPTGLSPKNLLVFSLQVYDYPKFLEVYEHFFGKLTFPLKGEWDARVEVKKFRDRVHSGIIKERNHPQSVAEMAQIIYSNKKQVTPTSR